MIDKVKNMPLVKEYRRVDLPVKALITFSVGFLLAPLSNSLLWFLLYLVVFEIILASFAGFDLYTRFVIIVASIVGWLLGRLIVNLDPLGEAKELIGYG